MSKNIDYEDTNIEPSNVQLEELSVISDKYVELEMAIADAETLLSSLKEKKWAIVRDDLPLLMKHLGMEKFVLSNGIEISVGDSISVSIPAVRKGEAMQWLKDNDAGSLVKGARTIMFDATESKQRDAFDKLWKGKKMFADLMQITEGAHTGSLKAYFKRVSEDEGGIPDDVTTLFGIYEFKQAKLKYPKNWGAS